MLRQHDIEPKAIEDEVKMHWREFRWIGCWLTITALVFLPMRRTLAQDPELLAQATAGDYQLELYTAIKKPFGLNGKEPLFPLIRDEQLDALTEKVAFGPWETSAGSSLTKDEYVLGFLVRNAQGEIPSGLCQLASAYRATMEGGQVESDWPGGGKLNPLKQVNAYKWRYQLTPMVIAVPKGAARIEKLEGALVIVPQDRTLITMNKEDINSKGAVYARQVTVFALGVEKASRGLAYTFVVCRSEKGKSAASKADKSLSPVNSVDLEFTAKTAEGKRVFPGQRLRIQLNESVKKKLVSEVVSKTRAQSKITAAEEAMLAVVSDPQAEFSVSQVAFPNATAEFEEFEVAINVTTGSPQLIPFEINDIALPAPAEVSVVNEFVAKQAVSQQDGTIESPLQFRTWRDATGAFSVEAKLVSIDANAVQLEKKNGDVIKVPIAKLSQEDQDYLADLNR